MMNLRTFRRGAILITLAVLTLVLASISVTSAEVTELNVDPQVVDPGDVITISGRASPDEEVWLSSSFKLSLTVSDGEYDYPLKGVKIPSGENIFVITAENVKNLNVRVKMLIWWTKSADATNGIATVSQSNLPSGAYDIRIDGDAADSVNSVDLKVTSSIKCTSDSNGDFPKEGPLELNTEGVPEGEFLITAGEKEKTVYVGVTPTPTPTPSPSPSPTPTPSSNGGNGGGNGNGGSGAPDTASSPTPSPSPTLSPSTSPSPTPTSTSTPIVTPPSTFTHRLTPTASPTPASVTPMPSPSSTPTSSQHWIPGFEAVFAIAGLLAVAYLVLRRKKE